MTRKNVKKIVIKKAGIPCARYHMVSTMEEGLAFIDEVGYPVIVKPDMGVGQPKRIVLPIGKKLRLFMIRSRIFLISWRNSFRAALFLMTGS